MKYYVKDLRLTKDENGERECHVELNNGSIVKICACYEGWEQYNGTYEELCTTVDIAYYVNEWLHTGKINEEDENEIYNIRQSIAEEYMKDNIYEVFDDIDNFDERLSIAISEMDHDRCTLQQAAPRLYNQMQDVIYDWCMDNDYYNADDFDIETIAC